MIEDRANAIIKALAYENIGEQDFQKQQYIKQKYKDLMMIQFKAGYDCEILAFEDYEKRVEDNSLDTRKEAYVIVGGVENPELGEQITRDNIAMLRGNYAFVCIVDET